jgi:hypothetical protein
MKALFKLLEQNMITRTWTTDSIPFKIEKSVHYELQYCSLSSPKIRKSYFKNGLNFGKKLTNFNFIYTF